MDDIANYSIHTFYYVEKYKQELRKLKLGDPLLVR